VVPPIPGSRPQPRPDFAPPAVGPELPGFVSLDLGTSSGYGEISAITRNPATGEAVTVATNTGATQYPWGREDYRERIEHRTWDKEPWNTAMEGEHEITVTLPDRLLKWEADLLFSSDRENFHYRYTRRLFEDGELLREKTWTETIPRDFQ
jgi:O-methyltransferase involved in polyketide biosynthesis